MKGFFALARKEMLEQRRTWRFLGTAGVLVAVALLFVLIPLFISKGTGDALTSDDARDLLESYGVSMVILGALVGIVIAMGLLANERSSGTAGMILSKPVTRAAFVAVKQVSMMVTLLAVLFLAAMVAYLLTVSFFGDTEFVDYILYMAGVGAWVVFTGSIAFFWSAVFRRQLVAAGMAFFIFIAQPLLTQIPKTDGYWPINVPEWAGRVLSNNVSPDNPGSWIGLAITLGGIAVLGVGAWAVFRRQEL